MVEKSWFFGGEEGLEPEYSQVDQAERDEVLLKNGYIPGMEDGLEVVPTDPESMSVKVKAGRAFINGYVYRNTEELEVGLVPADPANPRIDRIVARLDTVTGRKIYLAVVTGTPGVMPEAPALTRTAQIYEISMGQVYVGAGVTSVNAGNITNERDDEDVCGKALPWGFALLEAAIAALEAALSDIEDAVGNLQNPPVEEETGTSYTLVLADDGKIKELNNANPITLTVPTNASVPLPVGAQILVIQRGAGKVTITPADGVTINSVDDELTTIGQHAKAGLIKVATDEWDAAGQLEA